MSKGHRIAKMMIKFVKLYYLLFQKCKAYILISIPKTILQVSSSMSYHYIPST